MTKLRHCLIYPAERDGTVRIGNLAGLSAGEICVARDSVFGASAYGLNYDRLSIWPVSICRSI